MKELFKILFCLVVPTFLVAQTNNPLDYFPHHKGDLWQYVNLPENRVWDKKVENVDTINNEYVLISISYHDGSFEIPYKINFNDIATVYWVPDFWKPDSIWMPAYKFDAKENDFWISDSSSSEGKLYKGEKNDVVFGKQIVSREYWVVAAGDTSGIYAYSVDKLAPGIGLYYSEVEGGRTILLGCIINGVKYGNIVSVKDDKKNKTNNGFKLSSYPNPFNGSTVIYYEVPIRTGLTLKIFNVLGQEIKELFAGIKNRGQYSHIWYPENLSSGLYIIVLQTEVNIISTKLLYLK
jgi:hypothetical protein